MEYGFAQGYEDCLRELGWKLRREEGVLMLDGSLGDLAKHPAYSRPVPAGAENITVSIKVKHSGVDGMYDVDCLLRNAKNAQFFFYQKCGDRFNTRGLPSVESLLTNIDSELLGQKRISPVVLGKHEKQAIRV